MLYIIAWNLPIVWKGLMSPLIAKDSCIHDCIFVWNNSLKQGDGSSFFIWSGLGSGFVIQQCASIECVSIPNLVKDGCVFVRRRSCPVGVEEMGVGENNKRTPGTHFNSSNMTWVQTTLLKQNILKFFKNN